MLREQHRDFGMRSPAIVGEHRLPHVGIVETLVPE